jgi:sulfur carrier protein
VESSPVAITLNGQKAETTAANLSSLVAENGFNGNSVATAVNGRFVARAARETTKLTSGDTIEIVSARQGG